MALFILVFSYTIVSFMFFDMFREHITNAGFYRVLFISLIWPLSVTFGYVLAVIRTYKELKNHDE